MVVKGGEEWLREIASLSWLSHSLLFSRLALKSALAQSYWVSPRARLFHIICCEYVATTCIDMPLTVLVLTLLCAAAIAAWTIRAWRVREIREPQHGPSKQSQKLASHETGVEDTPPKQPYDAFLVVDVEGTCDQTAPWGYPNEIIVRTRLTLQMCHMLILGSRSGMARLSHAVDGQAKRTCL
jgi:hypothetical protein